MYDDGKNPLQLWTSCRFPSICVSVIKKEPSIIPNDRLPPEHYSCQLGSIVWVWPGINYVFSKRAFLFIKLIVLEFLCSWTMSVIHSAFMTIGNLTKQDIIHSNIFCKKFAFKIFWGWKLLLYWWWWPNIAKRFVCGSESYQGQVKTRQKETFDKVSLQEQSVSEDTILWPLVQKRSCR